MKFAPKQFFTRLYEKAFDEDIFSSAAQVGFYFMFALFPLLLFLVSLMGLVLEKADDLRAELFMYLRQVMPGSALELVETTLAEVVQSSSGGKLTLGFAIALWSASAGIDSVRVALNGVYKLKETRPYWKTKLSSLLITLAIALLIFIALGVIFYGSQFLSLIFSTVGLPIPSPLLLQILSFVVVGVVLTLAFALLYSFVPNHIPFTWNWITPGAIVAIILWVLASLGFRLYLNYFNSYAATYGSLGAIIILMLWLYITALAIIIGGAINAILNEFSQGKYTKEDRAGKAENEQVRDEAEKQEINQKEADYKSADKPVSKPAKTTGNSDSSKTNENTPVVEKSYAKMVAGGILGVLISLFSNKKNKP
ncbi:MAG TPA: YihY/virulence factor BrkB family protein [Pyrinomonadaceae bacterium]|nr:YihY/virulence factor BrkB family protein [Pyrinomonadaceae bacterium]